MKLSIRTCITRLAAAALLCIAPIAATAQEGVAFDWATEVGFPTAAGAYGRFMVVDSQDNTYACAAPWGSYRVVKIAPDGTLLWTQALPGIEHPRIHYLTVDSEDCAIVTGYDEGNWSIWTVKLDPAGNVLWSVYTQHGIQDEAFRVEVDAQDDVYVTGRSKNGQTYKWEAQTLKYDGATGNEQWFRRENMGHPTSMAVGADGRVVVAASNGDSWGLVSYDADGNQLWLEFFQPPNSQPYDVVMNEEGHAFVCGTVHVNNVTSGAVARFGTDGSLQWLAEYNGPNGSWDLFRRLTMDPFGNIVAVGQAMGVGYLDWSAVKFDPSGSVLWSAHYSGFDGNDEWATGVSAGPDGSVYVTGFAGHQECSAIPTMETTTVKYDPDGNEVWAHFVPCLGGASGSNDLDSSGGVVLNVYDKIVRLVNVLEPTIYCTAKVGSCGPPAMGSAGTPSASAPSGFFVFASPARAQRIGLLLYSDAGRAALPFDGGLLCVNPTALRRSIAVDSGGASGTCDGEFLLDVNAFSAGALGGNPAPFLVRPGTVVDAQWWGRDTLPTGSFLSDGLEYSVAP